MKSCYESYIENIVDDIRAELILNKKDIILDDRYIITLFKDTPVIRNNEYGRPVYFLYSALRQFLTDDDPIKAINKLNRSDKIKSLLKATIKYIKNKYDIADKYFN